MWRWRWRLAARVHALRLTHAHASAALCRQGVNKAVILGLVDELLAKKEVNIWWVGAGVGAGCGCHGEGGVRGRPRARRGGQEGEAADWHAAPAAPSRPSPSPQTSVRKPPHPTSSLPYLSQVAARLH